MLEIRCVKQNQCISGIPERHTSDTVILLKTAYFRHFEHFPAIEKFEKLNFAANHCEYV